MVQENLLKVILDKYFKAVIWNPFVKHIIFSIAHFYILSEICVLLKSIFQLSFGVHVLSVVLFIIIILFIYN